MSTVDLSRWATDFRKRYDSVRMQQGRVLTDDDFNEAERLDDEDMRRTRVDVIGATGSPDAGFSIDPTSFGKSPAGFPRFRLNAGTLYLGGLRLELFSPEWFEQQKDWLGFTPGDPDAPPALAAGTTRADLVWIEAWRQATSAVEDNELFEMALGGPDTTQRVRIMRRVKVRPGVAASDCNGAWTAAVAAWAGSGTLAADMELATSAKLKVTFDPAGGTPDLCSPPVQGGYLGAENQAIRVQLVDPTHFTWGFDNASPLYRVQVKTDTDPASPTAGLRIVVEMLTEPKDAVHWPRANQVIELLPWSAALPNKEKLAELSGLMGRVTRSYDPVTRTFHIAPEGVAQVPAAFGTESLTRADAAEFYDGNPAHFYLYLRVWDRGDDLASPIRIPTTPPPVKLGNTGLQVEFVGGPLRANDFWVIAARPQTPKLTVPWLLDSGAPPHGVKRYRAPLALVEWTADGAGNVTGKILHDCRQPFLPLTRLRGCCTVTVGDGSTSFGQYTSIQAAIDSLPPTGGTVCVLAGTYNESVLIAKKANVRVHGCGKSTRVRAVSAAGGGGPLPTFLVADSAVIDLDSMTLEAGPRSAVEIQNSRHVTVADCVVQMRDRPTLWQSIYSRGDDILIARNLIEVLPRGGVPAAPQPVPAIGQPGAPAGVATPAQPTVLAAATRGGIQIAGGSDRVKIVDNVIRGGIWNGITLGSVTLVGGHGDDTPDTPPSEDPCDPCRPGDLTEDDDPNRPVRVISTGDLYDIRIERNVIIDMGLSGIGVVRWFNLLATGQAVTVHGLFIRGNFIARCVRRELAPPTQKFAWIAAYGGIALAIAHDLRIVDNEIRDNGRSHLEPICGVFAIVATNLDLRFNRIRDNGPKNAEPGTAAKAGLRGGVWIWFAMPRIADRPVMGKALGRVDGASSAVLRDNLIAAPLGRAVTMFALGTVAVSDNRLASLGTTGRDLDLVAGTVLIGNLGIGNDWTTGLLNALYGAVFAPIQLAPGQASPYCAMANKEGVTTPPVNAFWPSGKTLFADNQVSLDLYENRSGFVLSSIAIASLDDVAFHGNQCEVDSLTTLLLVDAAVGGGTVRTIDNRFAETWRRALRSAVVVGGVMNTTTGNQATHCIDAFVLMGSLQIFTHNLVLAQAVCPDECKQRGDFRRIGIVGMAAKTHN
ncbi:MAG: DUF6519 domain-containing protein [Burkholderiales bacterium]